MKLRGIIAAVAASAVLLVACGEEVEFVSLSVGQCFDNPQMDGSGLTDVDVVDCDEPHVGEVYAAVTVRDGGFPGTAVLQAQAEEECLGTAFESYVGVDYNSSSLYAIPVFPSEASWEAGDRTTYCIAADGSDLATASPLEGSSRDSGR